MHKFDRRYYQLISDLQAVEFALVEVQLYLDTHPDDPRAVQDYNYLSQQLHCLKQEYERHYGPLMHFGFSMTSLPHAWVETPWPWEIEYPKLMPRAEQEV
ncbi:spore coat protein JB [Caldalkalibacillus uzonensis]|uniref:Spore coat protein JB n=1 Tax=Caldalkalibacillus uzonensis TaxID=353224 RepID=A0ABU0CNQ5_9BACI|nr:spore coat protein CotJB [Caldalkalibacillus uzonensis]MDQ0337782.1 spore coat protein JB [Caldalkalibacillus uzonensis]